MSSTVLDGVRVIDLSEVMQAPLSTQILADFGADVIKVERPGGDVMRSLDPESTEQGLVSSHFAALNRHKRSVCLDLKDPTDVEQLVSLIVEADVVVNNFRPGVMDRLGLSSERLRALNPRLIFATAYGFGPTGPLATKAGQDLVAQSITGIAMQRPSPDHDPYLHPVPFVDYAGGVSLALSIVLALFERQRSGEGQEVSISLFDTAFAIQTLEATSQLMYGRETNWMADHFPNQAFRTSDGWVAVLGFFRPNPLQLICRSLGLADLSQSEEFKDARSQAARRADLNDLLAPKFAALTTAECVRRLEEQDVLCAPLLGLKEALNQPQVEANGLISEVHTTDQTGLKTLANGLRLSRTPARSAGRVAALGEDTAAVLGGIDDNKV